MTAAKRETSRMLTVMAAGTVWFALIGQMYIALWGRWQTDASLIGGLINFFSYFTVTTNTLVAVVLTCAVTARDSCCKRFFLQPWVSSGIAVSIVVVGVSYSLLLRNVWNPQGFQWLVNELLHDVMPIVFLLYWGACVPRARLRWQHALVWAIYPVTYFVYAMIRGNVIGQYQYPFIDVAKLGFGQVLINSLVILAGFMLFSFALIGFDHWRAKSQ